MNLKTFDELYTTHEFRAFLDANGVEPTPQFMDTPAPAKLARRFQLDEPTLVWRKLASLQPGAQLVFERDATKVYMLSGHGAVFTIPEDHHAYGVCITGQLHVLDTPAGRTGDRGTELVPGEYFRQRGEALVMSRGGMAFVVVRPGYARRTIGELFTGPHHGRVEGPLWTTKQQPDTKAQPGVTQDTLCGVVVSGQGVLDVNNAPDVDLEAGVSFCIAGYTKRLVHTGPRSVHIVWFDLSGAV